MKDINRLKILLAERKRTAKRLATEISKGPATIFKWCTNTTQPSLDALRDISNALEINIQEL